MEMLDYRKEFIEAVKSIAAAEEDFDRSCFVNYATDRLTEYEELDEFQPAFWEGIGKRNRRLAIDGFALDDVDDSITLVIADYSGDNDPPSLTMTGIERLFDRLRGFVQAVFDEAIYREIEPSFPVYSIAQYLFENRNSIRRIRLFIVSDGVLSNRVKELPNKDIGNIITEHHVWDITRFHRVFESYAGRDELLIDFTEYSSGGIPCLEASSKNQDYGSYLCVLPGTLLAEIYDNFGSRLLERNVRSFLSTRGKVNKGIRTTILNTPGRFFAYNNGIAATATEVEVQNTDRGLCLLKCKDLQIVNGGQTTASILMAKYKDKANLDGISVPMKLSVVSADTAEELIPEIARCANSQNKVSDADFFSNHPFHVRIEEMSRRMWAPPTTGSQLETRWFYERARGQYLNEQAKLTPSAKKRFSLQYPRTQVITKTDLAKFRNAWAELPHIVSLGAQKNFVKFSEVVSKVWESDNAEIDEEFYRTSVALAILYKHTEKIVSKQPWYNGGFRAQIVAYTIAKLAHDIKKFGYGRTLDLRAIWNAQSVPKGVDKQLTIVAKHAFDVITNPESGFGNQSEWSKKPRCWQILQEESIPLCPEMLDCMVDMQQVKSAKRETRAQQKVDNGIQAQIQVANYGGQYWEKARSFGLSHHLLTQDEESLLRVASKIGQGALPTDRQSSRLLGIRSKLEEEGFAG